VKFTSLGTAIVAIHTTYEEHFSVCETKYRSGKTVLFETKCHSFVKPKERCTTHFCIK